MLILLEFIPFFYYFLIILYGNFLCFQCAKRNIRPLVFDVFTTFIGYFTCAFQATIFALIWLCILKLMVEMV